MWRKDEKFCYPSDFYWFNKDSLKQCYRLSKFKIIIFMILFLMIATVCMLGYYLLYPFQYIYHKCENWCYK